MADNVLTENATRSTGKTWILVNLGPTENGIRMLFFKKR